MEDPVGMEAKTVHDAESLGFVAECKSYLVCVSTTVGMHRTDTCQVGR